ncbi:membrane-associated tyrosine- and threonine-specific cdc2-inhibitory kinase, partial [Corapipo altera]|uniref:membrane-associated tyrosine- and threonine-specific cdc2-inhibitory kinase n=1 Tax=Corapipo altera TaxID=415028 RepID=UPI000FD67B5D
VVRVSDGRPFALKRSLRPLSGPAQRRHWLREVSAHLGAGPHPHLLPLEGAWLERGRLHLLTPPCPGGSLGDQWRKGGGASRTDEASPLAERHRGGVVSSLTRSLLAWWRGGGVASKKPTPPLAEQHPGGVANPQPTFPSPLAESHHGGVASPKPSSPLAEQPQRGVASPKPSSPLAEQPWGGVANPQTTFPSPLAEPPQRGVASPKPSSPLAERPRGGVSPPRDGSPLAEWRLWGYLWDILGALSHLHARNWAHLDVKPDNVLLDPRGRCRLADFGTATPPGEGEGLGGGDPRYVAPEVLEGSGGPPGDVFSLGLSLLELGGSRRLPGWGEGWRRLRSGGGAEGEG